MALLDELREELHAEPITVHGVEREVKALVTDILTPVGQVIGQEDPELAGAVAERLRHERAVQQWREMFMRNVFSTMLALGYTVGEAEEVAGTVVVDIAGETVGCTFAGPPRVVAFFDAVREGDLERADLILHAREG